MDYEESNGKLLALLSDYLNFGERTIDGAQIEVLTSLGLTREQAFRRLLAAHTGTRDEVLLGEYFPHIVKELSAREYRADPYYKNIRFEKKTLGNWEIGRGEYAPYELFVFDDFSIEGEKLLPQVGFFAESFEFPAVYENGRMWMSVTPNEINTMRLPVSRARGKALTFGLGLGYFAYMCAEKDEVESITVVERDESVIGLFERFVLPQFARADKVRIIKADAYEFFDGLSDGEYDTAFVDIYHDAGNGMEVYKKFKKRTFVRTLFDFWIEKTMEYYLG